MLSKVVPQCIHSLRQYGQLVIKSERQQSYALELPGKLLIRLRLPTRLQELVCFQGFLWVLIKETPNIVAGRRINDIVVLRTANLIILVEDGLIRNALVNASQTVVKSANVNNTPCETKSSTA